MKKVILLGGGGHCKVVVDAILLSNEIKIAAILDIVEKIGQYVCGVKITGCDDELERFFGEGINYAFVCVGSVYRPTRRASLYNKLINLGFESLNVIHPSSSVSPFAFLGSGNYIGPKAVVNAGAKIGDNCIINSAAVVEHDCIIEDNVHISPGVFLGGGTKVCQNTHFGIGAVAVQGVTIGENTLIGAGAVVVKDIESNVVAFGNPCKKIRKNV